MTSTIDPHADSTINALPTPTVAHRRRRGRLAAALLAVVLVAAACGSGDDAADDPAPSADAGESTGTDTSADDTGTGADEAPGDDAGGDDSAAATPDDTNAGTDAEVDPVCATVADALAIGDGVLSPGMAAEALLADDPPTGVLEALETIIAIEFGQDVILSEGEVNDRIQGYYSFCPDVDTAAPPATADAPPPCAFPPPPTFYVADGEAIGGMPVLDGPGNAFAEIDFLPRGTEFSTTGACATVDGIDWWEVETGSVFGWADVSFISSVDDFTLTPDESAAPVDDADELGIGCYYKFDDAACAAYGFDNPAAQGPTDLLEAGCRASSSRRTLECAELVTTRGITFDDATADLQLEIIQAAGARCEEGADTFANPDLHPLACEYGQISAN